jgi:hypothetical protein
MNKTYMQIKGIKAFVGGYFGASYLVIIDLKGLNINWVHWEEGKEIETYQKKIRVKTAERFIDQLKSVNLLDWKRRYENPGVLDGTGGKLRFLEKVEILLNLEIMHFLMNGMLFVLLLVK